MLHFITSSRDKLALSLHLKFQKQKQKQDEMPTYAKCLDYSAEHLLSQMRINYWQQAGADDEEAVPGVEEGVPKVLSSTAPECVCG
jgi:hypothetical protein